MSSPHELPVGTVFASDYRLERVIGQGGMGAVYLAHQLSTGRPRALKLMHPNLLRDETMRRRFEQEAKVGSRIRSDHVVQVIAAGVDEASNVPWLAMEFLEGEDLHAYVRSRGALTLADAEPILKEVCHALAAAHEVGVVHRDLKPENVFLTRARREGSPVEVRVLDFGIAKIVAEANASQTGALGTPLWMAPEQTGGAVSPATDVWALGLVAFWMLTGRSYWLSASDPTREASIMAILREVAYEPLVSASQRARELGVPVPLPPGFDEWFARCVCRDVSARFAEAGQARTAFAQWIHGGAQTLAMPLSMQAPLASSTFTPASQSSVAHTPARTMQPKKNATIVVASLLALAGLGVVARFVARDGRGAGAAPAASASASSAPAVASAVASAEAPSVTPIHVDQEDSKTIWRVPLGDSPVRGPADALVTVVEFGNFQCPFSKGVERKLQKLLSEYPRTLRLVWKDDPLAIHSLAEGAVQLAREARAQKGDEGFWSAHDALLDPDFVPAPAQLVSLGKKLGLDADEVAKAIASKRYQTAVDADIDLADDFVTVGTPYFFVNGRRIQATITLDKVRAAIAEETTKAEELVKAGASPADVYDKLTGAGNGAVPLETRRFHLKSATNASLGGDSPAVLLFEFCSYGNFFCGLIAPTVDKLLDRYAGKLSEVFLDLPDPKAPESRGAALAARYSFINKGSEGFRKMRRFVLDGAGNDGGLSPYALEQYARAIGFPKGEMKKALADPELHAAIDDDAELARQANIATGPGFLVCGADLCANGGYYLSGGQSFRSFEKRIRLVLESAKAQPAN